MLLPVPSKLIKQNCNFLKNVQKHGRNRSTVHQLMSGATDRQLLCFVEICFNILKGRVPLSKRQLYRLQRQAHLLRKLSRIRTVCSARHLLTKPQHGRGIPAVAGVLASILVPMLSDAIFSKKTNK